MAKEHEVPKTLEADCPSCGVRSSFKYIGSQIWPEEVAANLGVPTKIALYQCENCLTTISGQSILPGK